MPKRLLAIIVLYQTKAEESDSYQSLLDAARQTPTTELDLHILVYDNTPDFALPPTPSARVTYLAATDNRGLSEAYNYALDFALSQGYEWLMTLDQDTILPTTSLRSLVSVMDRLDTSPDIAAIVPMIRASDRFVSPNIFVAGVWPRWFPAGFSGIPKEVVYAFNSGATLRIDALREVGGYSPWFWLDNSDAWIFSQFAHAGKRVFVAGEIEINHNFSMMNMRERVSPTRYEHLLLAESAFWDLRMNWLAGWERNLRLSIRLVKHLLHKQDPALQRLTRCALIRRLVWSRRRRLDLWQQTVSKHLGGEPREWKRPETTR